MPQVIKSHISDEFEGTDDEMEYELDNGQKWQQVDFHYHYYYHHRPAVEITVTSSGEGIMKVEGFPNKIRVRRVY